MLTLGTFKQSLAVSPGIVINLPAWNIMKTNINVSSRTTKAAKKILFIKFVKHIVYTYKTKTNSDYYD